MIWSDKAIDYSAGFDITDPVTGKVYSDSEARIQEQYIKTRLVLRPRKIGTYVLTLEECDSCLEVTKRINTSSE